MVQGQRQLFPSFLDLFLNYFSGNNDKFPFRPHLLLQRVSAIQAFQRDSGPVAQEFIAPFAAASPLDYRNILTVDMNMFVIIGVAEHPG